MGNRIRLTAFALGAALLGTGVRAVAEPAEALAAFERSLTELAASLPTTTDRDTLLAGPNMLYVLDRAPDGKTSDAKRAEHRRRTNDALRRLYQLHPRDPVVLHALTTY